MSNDSISIDKQTLQDAMAAWVRDVRAGRCRTDAETAALPESLVAMERSAHLWSLLAPTKTGGRGDVPIEPGTPFEGGFYVARYRLCGKLFALIVSPKAGDLPPAAWGEFGQEVAGAGSFVDGLANTRAMAEAGNPLAQRVLQLEMGGFADWYLPARDELELLYRHLKPTADENVRYSGDNPSAVPPTWPYRQALPAQTSASAFQAGGAAALERTWYWSSTQYSAHYAWSQWFDDGCQYDGDKYGEGRARAVRRLILE